jgi:hypothetical protein
MKMNRCLEKFLLLQVFTVILVASCAREGDTRQNKSRDTALSFPAGRYSQREKEEIAAVLHDVDALFKDYYRWKARLYDPQTGGFYFAYSALEDTKKFRPDIESTAQGLGRMISFSGLADGMPPSMKKGFIRFFQSRQDPESGFFFDPHVKELYDDRMRGRALSYCMGGLRRLGAKPLYPLPGKKKKSKKTGKGKTSYIAHLDSPEAFRKWLDARPWDNTREWIALCQISAQSGVIRSMPEKKRKALLDTLFKYLAKKQDPKTGLWGGGSPYVKISGAFKITMIFRMAEQPVPLADLIYSSTLDCIRNNEATNICFARNPLELLRVIEGSMTKPIPAADRVEIIRISTRNLKRFLRPDGGFSYNADRSISTINNSVPVGKGHVEGDMNGSSQALWIRRMLYDLAGVKYRRPEFATTFYPHLRTCHPSTFER